MSHAAGLVRTTCSSGSAPGAGAGAGPLGASSSEGLLDPVYPRTHAAMLKVAQMVREAGARAGVPRGDRGGRGPGGGAPAAGASRPGRGRAPPRSRWRGFLRRGIRRAPALLRAPSSSSRSAGSACLGPQEATAKVPSAFLPLLGPRRFGPARGWGVPGGGAQAAEAGRLQLSGRRGFLANPAPLGLLPPERPRPSAGSAARPSGGRRWGTLGAAVPGPAPRLPREGLPSGPLDGSGHSGGLCAL